MDVFLGTEGVAVRRLDLESATPGEVSAAVGDADLVFVTGGYPIFLLQHAQRTGFLDAVTSRPVAYAGMSAGAALAAPDLAGYRTDDDPGRVTETAGLGLVPFYPMSHANRREERYAEMIARDGHRFDLVPIRDDEAVLVRNGERRKCPSADSLTA